MRIAILDDWERAALASADWSSLGDDARVTVFEEPFASVDDLVAAISGAEVVVAMRERTRFPAEVIRRLPALRLLVTTGSVNAAIDFDACREHGVVVCGTRSHGGGAAEHTWALILAAARRLHRVLPAMRSGWPSSPGLALAGRRLGLLGFGRVGTAVARVGAAFDMDVVAWSPSLTPERAAAAGARAAERDEVVRTADILSLHLALDDTTRGTVDAALLARMKPEAWLVNTARAGLVDEAALFAALDDGRLAGAAVDVFDAEPLPADSPWRRRDDVVITPHLGYVTDRNWALWFHDAVEDIAAWREGRSLRSLT